MLKNIVKIILLTISLSTVVGLAQPSGAPPDCFPCDDGNRN